MHNIMKLTNQQSWDLAKSIATKCAENSISKVDIEKMNKSEMAEKYSSDILNFADKISNYDGKDIDEDNTFDYFKTLVLFNFAIISKQ